MGREYFCNSRKHEISIKEKIIKRVKRIRQSFLLKKNKLGSKKRNDNLANRNFTIISNNCFAGLTYEYLDLPYSSPTIGLYIFAKDYIKFIYNLKYYFNFELKELKASESKYYYELLRLGQEDSVMGILDDVEIVFLHYKSFEEARDKWERRCKRVNYDNII